MKEITIIALIGIALSLLVYRFYKFKDNNLSNIADASGITYGNISKSEANSLLQNNKDIVLLDVRTEDEHAERNIPNSILIPVNELKQRLSQLNKEKTYILYCKSGSRSNTALSILNNNGFEKVYNLIGGITEYYK